MNLSEDKDYIRSSSHRQTKLHAIDVNLSSYDGCKYMFPELYVPSQLIMYDRLQSLGILPFATMQFARQVMAKMLISTFKPDRSAAFPFFIFISALLTISVGILIEGPWNSCSSDKVLLSQENSALRSFLH